MKLNSLHHVLLAGLEATPRSGYDLTQWLARVGRHFWAAEHSSIYPALQYLESEGLLTCNEAPGLKGQPRKMYRLSAAGRRKLKRWVDTPSSDPQIRDEQMVKVLCFDLLPPERIREHLERIREQHAAKMIYYEGLLEEHRHGDGHASRSVYRFRFGPQLTLRRGIIAAKGYVQWCDEALAVVCARNVTAKPAM